MNKGKIIFLNGVTSSGKTSIVDALQERRDVFFYVVANDLFQEMVGEQYLQEDYWKYLSEVIIMMYHTAKLYSDMGKNVLIDGILVEREEIKPHYKQLMEIMKDSPLEIVEVYCPLDVCKQRNIERGDRYESQSEEQAALMSKDIAYSLRVDTNACSPEECAEQIVRKYFGPHMILLNGPSSAGKSTLSHELKKRFNEMGIDSMIISIDDYMQTDPKETIYEDDIYEIMPNMNRDVKDAIRQGKTIIVDHAITSERIYDSLMDAAKGGKIFTVKVICDIEILRKREIERGDRCIGSAEASLEYLWPKEGYDLCVDNGKKSSAENAEIIIKSMSEL